MEAPCKFIQVGVEKPSIVRDVVFLMRNVRVRPQLQKPIGMSKYVSDGLSDGNMWALINFDLGSTSEHV